jgi:flagellar biosynthesis protein FlhA
VAESGSLKRVFNVGKYGDIPFAISLIAVVMVMIIPLPTFVLDLALSFNIAFSLVLLLTSIYVIKPLELSVFPSLMLLVTLLRLSLNVASTRPSSGANAITTRPSKP